MRAIKNFSAVALFCEDIRQESNGMHSIVGTFRDNIAGSVYPGHMPRLGIFMRANFPKDSVPENVSMRLEIPWLSEPLSLSQMDKNALYKARENALAEDNEFVGVIMTAVVSPFLAKEVGRVVAVLTVDNRDHVIGSLKFINRPEITPEPGQKKPKPKKAGTRKIRQKKSTS